MPDRDVIRKFARTFMLASLVVAVAAPVLAQNLVFRFKVPGLGSGSLGSGSDPGMGVLVNRDEWVEYVVAGSIWSGELALAGGAEESAGWAVSLWGTYTDGEGGVTTLAPAGLDEGTMWTAAEGGLRLCLSARRVPHAMSAVGAAASNVARFMFIHIRNGGAHQERANPFAFNY